MDILGSGLTKKMKIELYNFDQKNKWIDQFENLRKNILESTDKKKNNYSEKNLNLSLQEYSTIIFVENEIAAFSFLFSRPEWKNSSRVFNRYYILPKFRSKLFEVQNKFNKLMMDEQIKFAREIKKDFVFISREYPSLAWIKKIEKMIYENKNEYLWNIDKNNLFKVCNSESIVCWQHCAWYKLNPQMNEFPFMSKNIKDFQ